MNNIYNDTLAEAKHSDELDHLRSMVCSMNPRSVCVPDDNTDSLLSVRNIANSFYSPNIICQENPCPHGYFPGLDDNGYFICEGLIDNRTVLIRTASNCKKNQVFLYGRCRPRNFRHKKRKSKKKSEPKKETTTLPPEPQNQTSSMP